MMEEQELALRCANGDHLAQRELYEKYRSRIIALCRRYTSNPADAEDMMQDAFIKIFKVIGSFRWTRPGSLYSWMARVTINLNFDSAKKRRNLTRQLVDINTLKDDISDDTVYEETATVPPEILKEMIDALPEGYRTIFCLYCIDGLSHREIAKLLRIKERSSSSSLHRARTMLSEAIRQYWRDLEDGSSSDGWTMILSKMKKEKAIRNILLVFAVLIPATSLLLWHQTRMNNDHTVPFHTQLLEVAPSVLLSTPLELPMKLAEGRYVITTDSNDSQNVADTVPAYSAQSSDSLGMSSGSTYKILEESRPDASEIHPIFADDTPTPGRKLSFSLKAGSGSTRRNSEITLESAPYIAALTYMNSAAPNTLLDAKSNTSNAIPWYYENHAGDTKPDAKNIYHHDLPMTFGLCVRMDLTSRIGLESGLEYTYMHSTVDTEDGQLAQRLHFIGIPIRFDTRVWAWNGLDLYVGIGSKMEKCISASLGKISCEEKRLQWSAGAFAGIQYRLGRHTNLYFQPDISYCFTTTDLITYRTENPLTISLNAGLRFDL